MEKEKKRTVKDENYYQISGWMVNPDKLNLSGLELSVYAIIFGFSQARDNCYHNGTNYLAEFTGGSDRGIRKAIKSLKDKGLLIERKEGYQRYSYIAVVPDFDEYNSAQTKMKSKNDELSSANDELSSANDELSSANGELSSANDELSSANDELSSTHNIYNADNHDIHDNQTKNMPAFYPFPDLPNIKITLAELRFLLRYYEQKDVNRAMTRLNSYIDKTGHNYESHFDTLEKWINEDAEKQKSVS